MTLALPVVASLAERRQRRRPPRPPARYAVLLTLVVALTALGLVMVLSASSVQALHHDGSSWRYFTRQAMWTGIGVVALIIGIRVDHRRWRRLAGPLVVLAGISLLLVLVPGLGVRVNGARSWLGLGELRFQPSELAKLALLLFSADLLARRARFRRDTRLTLRPVLAVAGPIVVLQLAQPDLGTTVVTVSAVATVLFVGGVPLAPLGGLAALAGGLASWFALAEGYRRARLLAFLDPMADPLNTGYQTVQSLSAFGTGGIWGVGLGSSRAKWGYLPHAHTDFIFAIIGEELGLVGALAVVAAVVGVALAGWRVAQRAPDEFGRLLAAGITAWIVVQALVNIGGTVALVPVTGLPLPFVSFGGSSLVVLMAATGILLNIARSSPRPAPPR